jgi:hypothetical protein
MDQGEVVNEHPSEGSDLSGSQTEDGRTCAARGTSSPGDELGVCNPTANDGTQSQSIKLQPTYHAQLQEALIRETEPEKYKLLAELVESEASREFGAWTTQSSVAASSYRQSIASAKKDLYWSSLVNLIKWAAPALLTYAFAKWMIHFYDVSNKEGAATCKEILLLLAGGTLGWIAKDRKES